MWNKFLIIFFIPIIVALSAVAFFNYDIDPYHLRKVEGREGINKSRIYSADRERALKPLMYLRANPEVVILGDSKSGFSMNPEKVSEILGVKNAFNLSLRNATPGEIYELLKFAVEKNENLKHIIICLDFEMFGENEPTKPGFSKTLLSIGTLPPEEKFSSILSLSTFCDSLETVRLNSEKNLPVIYKNDGEISETHLINFFKNEGSFDRNSDSNIVKFKLLSESEKYRKIYLKSYCRDMNEIHKIKDFLVEKGVDYTVIVLPVHNDELTALNNNFYKTFQKQIKSIFPNVCDLTHIASNDKKSFYDSVHPKKEFTMELLQKLFNGEKIENIPFSPNENLAKNLATGIKFNGTINIDNSVKTKLLAIDAKLLKYGVLHFTGDSNIKSEDAYFLLENGDDKFLFKAARYGEIKSQNIFNIISKKYDNFPFDGRGITDNLPNGRYNLHIGILRDNVLSTDGVKVEFEF